MSQLDEESVAFSYQLDAIDCAIQNYRSHQASNQNKMNFYNGNQAGYGQSYNQNHYYNNNGNNRHYNNKFNHRNYNQNQNHNHYQMNNIQSYGGYQNVYMTQNQNSRSDVNAPSFGNSSQSSSTSNGSVFNIVQPQNQQRSLTGNPTVLGNSYSNPALFNTGSGLSSRNGSSNGSAMPNPVSSQGTGSISSLSSSNTLISNLSHSSAQFQNSTESINTPISTEDLKIDPFNSLNFINDKTLSLLTLGNNGITNNVLSSFPVTNNSSGTAVASRLNFDFNEASFTSSNNLTSNSIGTGADNSLVGMASTNANRNLFNSESPSTDFKSTSGLFNKNIWGNDMSVWG